MAEYTKVPGGWVEVDRPPPFKVGDQVIYTDWYWFAQGKKYRAKVVMVGVLDTSDSGGIPLNPGYPALVYGYNLQIERDGGVYIYRGVPEFYMKAIKKK